MLPLGGILDNRCYFVSRSGDFYSPLKSIERTVPSNQWSSLSEESLDFLVGKLNFANFFCRNTFFSAADDLKMCSFVFSETVCFGERNGRQNFFWKATETRFKVLRKTQTLFYFVVDSRYHCFHDSRDHFSLLISFGLNDRETSSNPEDFVKICLGAFIYCFLDSSCYLYQTGILLFRKAFANCDIPCDMEQSLLGAIQRS